MTIEYVDVLAPPSFQPSGVTKPVHTAIEAGDWVGVMNLWIVRSDGRILYQLRPPTGGWEPDKLDGSVGGYYRAGETGLDGLREAREELGVDFPRDEIAKLGNHLSVGVDSRGRRRHLVVTVFMMISDIDIHEFEMDPEEVPGLFEVPAESVIRSFSEPNWSFVASGIACDGTKLERRITRNSFSYIFGGYHKKIAQISKRFASGDRDVWY